MRQIPLVLLLLTGVSCTTLDQPVAPFDALGRQQMVLRPVAPLPATWKNPAGQTVGTELPTDLSPDPTARTASRGSPATRPSPAATSGATQSASAASSPAGLRPLPDLAYESAYAGSSKPATAGGLPGSKLTDRATLLPGPEGLAVLEAPPPPAPGTSALAKLSANLPTSVGPQAQASGMTSFRADKPSQQVAQASFVERRGDPSPAENQNLSQTSSPTSARSGEGEKEAGPRFAEGVGRGFGTGSQSLPLLQLPAVSTRSAVSDPLEAPPPLPALPQAAATPALTTPAAPATSGTLNPTPAPAPTLTLEPPAPPAQHTQYTQPTQQASPPAGMPVLRVVNSKRITLDFELKDAGPGLTGVDLWVTRDMRSWKKQEAVRASAKAYMIEVKEEGLYGLTMMARSNQTAPAAPQPGDLPQVWVTVDVTPPTVQLLGVELGLTSKDPTLVVRWRAQDRNFHKRPIVISCAEQPEGPWMTLASGVENTGRYEVPLSVSLPRRMFLRVEAQDLAGNVGRAQTSGAIRLELPWASSATTASLQAHEAPRLIPPPPGPEARPQVSIIDVDAVER